MIPVVPSLFLPSPPKSKSVPSDPNATLTHVSSFLIVRHSGRAPFIVVAVVVHNGPALVYPAPAAAGLLFLRILPIAFPSLPRPFRQNTHLPINILRRSLVAVRRVPCEFRAVVPLEIPWVPPTVAWPSYNNTIGPTSSKPEL